MLKHLSGIETRNGPGAKWYVPFITKVTKRLHEARRPELRRRQERADGPRVHRRRTSALLPQPARGGGQVKRKIVLEARVRPATRRHKRSAAAHQGPRQGGAGSVRVDRQRASAAGGPAVKAAVRRGDGLAHGQPACRHRAAALLPGHVRDDRPHQRGDRAVEAAVREGYRDADGLAARGVGPDALFPTHTRPSATSARRSRYGGTSTSSCSTRRRARCASSARGDRLPTRARGGRRGRRLGAVNVDDETAVLVLKASGQQRLITTKALLPRGARGDRRGAQAGVRVRTRSPS